MSDSPNPIAWFGSVGRNLQVLCRFSEKIIFTKRESMRMRMRMKAITVERVKWLKRKQMIVTSKKSDSLSMGMEGRVAETCSRTACSGCYDREGPQMRSSQTPAEQAAMPNWPHAMLFIPHWTSKLPDRSGDAPYEWCQLLRSRESCKNISARFREWVDWNVARHR